MDIQKKISDLKSLRASKEERLNAITAQVEKENRSRTAEERTEWANIEKEISDIDADVKDFTAQHERNLAAAKANGSMTALPATHETPGKELLGKSERKNVRSAKIANFFRAANPALGYKLEGVEKELDQVAKKEFNSFGSMPDYNPEIGTTIPAVALRYMDWSRDQYESTEKRDIQATVSAGGIELINTDNLASNYVQALRPQNVLMNAGVRVIQNDSGSNIVFPRENSLYTAAMASTENAAATESLTGTQFINPALTFSPKRGTGFVQVSNQLLLQSGWWEPLLREQIILGNATLYDVQGITGSGSSGQAKGILNTSGTQTVLGGTNGANFARTHITQFESGVGAAGANLNNCVYITNFNVNAYGKRTEFSSGSGRYLIDSAPMWSWDNGPRGNGAMSLIDQYPVYLSANVPSNLTKGTSTTICSAVIFGDVSKMVYMNFGGLQVIVDPYVAGQNALTNYYVHFWFDFNVILPGAVSFSADMLTP